MWACIFQTEQNILWHVLYAFLGGLVNAGFFGGKRGINDQGCRKAEIISEGSEDLSQSKFLKCGRSGVESPLSHTSAVLTQRKLSDLPESPFLHLPNILCEDQLSLHFTSSAFTTGLLLPLGSGGVGGIASGFSKEGKATRIE